MRRDRTDMHRADRAFLRYQQKGRPADLAEVFDEIAPALHRLAARLSNGDRATADDLVQATFLTAIETASEFDAAKATSGVAGWLTGILKNQARLAQRRARRRPDPTRLPDPEPLDPILDAERSELDREVGESIAALSPTLRPVVHLHLLHGLSAKEIAVVLDRPAGTVRTQVVRGLTRLRELLPAGLAGVLAGLLPSAGSAAVREVVLRGAQAKAASTAASLGGPSFFATTITALSMKKATLAVFVVALAVIAGLVFADPFAGDDSQDRTDAPPARIADSTDANERVDRASPGSDDPAARSESVGPSPVDEPASPLAVLRGRVLNALGGPVADARVLVWPTRSGGPSMIDGRFASEPEVVLRTDPLGRFEVPWFDDEFSLAAEQRSGDRVLSLSSTRLSGTLSGREEIEGLELELQTAVAFDGVVLDHSGAPVADARVGNAEGYTSGGPGFRGIHDVFAQWPVPQRTTTDSSGRFSLFAVADRALHWDVHAEGRPFVRLEHRAVDGFLEIRIPAGKTIRGTVFRSDGRAAVGARVQLGRVRDTAVECDARGFFVMTGLDVDPETSFLNVFDQESAVRAVQPIPMDGTPLQVFLEEPAPIAGVAVDEGGRPVPGARITVRGDRELELAVVYAERATWEWAQSEQSTETDAEGRFTLPRLYRGRFELTLEHPDDRSVARVLEVTSPADLGSVELHRAVSDRVDLPFEVVGAAGEPMGGVPGVEVRLGRQIQDGYFRNEAVEVGHDGRGVVRGVPRSGERLTLSVEAPGFARSEIDPLSPADQLQSGEPIRLVLLEPRHIEVRVQTSSGEPVPGMMRVFDASTRTPLWLDAGGGSRMLGQSVGRGPVELRGLPAKSVLFAFTARAGGDPIEWNVDLTEQPDEVLTFVVGAVPEDVELGVIVVPMQLDPSSPLRDRLLGRGEVREIHESGDALAAIEDRVVIRLTKAGDGFEIATAEATRLGVDGPEGLPRWSIRTSRFDGTQTSIAEMPAPLPMIAVSGLLEPMRLEIRCDGFETRIVDVDRTMIESQPAPDGTIIHRAELIVPIAREREMR